MDDAASNSARNSVHREHLLKRYFVLLFIRAILLIKNEIENGFQKKKKNPNCNTSIVSKIVLS